MISKLWGRNQIAVLRDEKPLSLEKTLEETMTVATQLALRPGRLKLRFRTCNESLGSQQGGYKRLITNLYTTYIVAYTCLLYAYIRFLLVSCTYIAVGRNYIVYSLIYGGSGTTC